MGEGRRGKESVEGRTGTLGDEAAGVPVRGEAGPRTRGDLRCRARRRHHVTRCRV